MAQLTICIAEDRPAEIDALRLLIASLGLHLASKWRIVVYHPHDNAMLNALADRMPGVKIIRTGDFAGVGWNLKPMVLLRHLTAPGDRALWIDADIIASRDFSHVLEATDQTTFLATEEPWFLQLCRGDSRARAWGFTVGREMKRTVNSGVVLASYQHRPLLEDWQALLESETYVRTQRMIFEERPTHMRGDQDVLTALLCSPRHSGIPLKLLRAGPDIIQYSSPAGYGLASRLQHIRSRPYFVHAMRRKPWRMGLPGDRPSLLDRIIVETSPYFQIARETARQTDLDLPWLQHRSLISRAMGGPLFMQGVPMSLADEAVRLLLAMGRPIA